MKEIDQLKKLVESIDEAEQVLGSDHTTYDIDFDNEDVTIFTLGGEPVAEMSIDAWEALIKKYQQIQRGRQGPA